ncbi:hypothetical protein [Streptomyces agglomeratus]|uniref:hypothetical protein n=1 Tax=Streptomyces agglomeratus TaxID=285458 RepID=UPI001FD17F13|nr:hypothetical protein [Streptomyces agglomeratus]
MLSVDAGRVVLRSRNGADLAPSFPEVCAATLQLPDATALDGELVAWESGRTAFERLQGRLQRRGAGADMRRPQGNETRVSTPLGDGGGELRALPPASVSWSG